MKSIITLSLIIAYSFISANYSFGQSVGEKAPDFSIETLSNGTYKLSEQANKVVVIYFLGNACPFCISAAPKVQSDIYSKFSDRTDFSLIGIDTWSQSSARLPSFKTQTNVSFPLGVNGSSVASNYSSTYDRLIVIDKDGLVFHKGNTAAGSDINSAVEKINTALAKMATSINNIEDKSVILSQNYPNPVTGVTTISFGLKRSEYVDISVYDITGKVITNIIAEQKSVGDHEIQFDASALKSGIYYYQLKAGDIVETRRMLVK